MNNFDIREWALETGRALAEENGDRSQAWLLSPVDTWERNPFYQGPANPRHPEDQDDYEYTDADGVVRTAQAWRSTHFGKNVADYVALTDIALRSTTSEAARRTLLRYAGHLVETFTSIELAELAAGFHGAPKPLPPRTIDSIDPDDIQF